MDNILFDLMDYQKFQRDPVIEDMICHTREEYGTAGQGEERLSDRMVVIQGKLSDAELSSVSAAGMYYSALVDEPEL